MSFFSLVSTYPVDLFTVLGNETRGSVGRNNLNGSLAFQEEEEAT